MNNTLKSESNKIPSIVIIFSFLYFFVILISLNIPMFWDMANISWLSNLIYDNHFSNFIFPDVDTDQGAMPLYSVYIAVLWKIFGKSLWVCHAAILPFVIGMVFQFYKLASRFIEKKYLWVALLLLFIEPTLFTQVFLAGNDLVFCFLFLLGVNSAIDNRKILLLLAIAFIPVLRLRGFTFVFSILLIDWYMNHTNYKGFIDFILKRFYIYVTPLIVLLIWFFYHYYSTGWVFINDDNKGYHQIAGLERMFRNLIYIAWKVFDFGRIFLFIPVLFFFIFRKKNDANGNQLFFILLFTIIPYLIFFVPMLYPVSHRHFMTTYIVGIILFVYYIGTIKIYFQKFIFPLIILIFISGNFWIYPERYGNGWDASMKVYPYFSLKNKFDDYIKGSGINSYSVGAKAPMDFDLYNTNMQSEKFGYKYIENELLENYKYVVQSNICNTFTPDEMNELNKNWIIEKEFYSWPLYIKLFKNPVNKE
ncbi:MAG TPA: hypothetical protein PKK00_01210 [Bacteroidales bacterium]|nr:hypothetical protein [Bacteroidales bacterium]HPS16064.1 hypothetical protein [Bacteroidales bacterium]